MTTETKRCNRCFFMDIAKTAETHKGYVVIRPGEAGGYDVSILYPGDQEAAWAAHFQRLTQQCVCGN